MDDLFLKIIAGEIPSKKIYENDSVYAFEDINPKAPVHILVVHKERTESINDTDESKAYIYSDLFLAVRKIAQQLGIDESGYRTIINTGSDGGQEVFHLHVHLLAGKKLGSLV
ncbi:MAG: histidine triad nucleotide-binding protein [Spirochaetes bacterium]|jgi:histidine triad (HIT) family protein|nr:histidine triad nucleotide-binding protein [Spirochaetota bacterium]